jgi:hypothetical protein
MVVTVLAASGLGAGDCEAIRSGFLAQPGNALSSLGFVVAGFALILLRRRLPETGRFAVAGGLLVAVGAGSFLYHGPVPAGAQLLHDVTIGALLGFLAWWSAPGVFSRWGWLVAAGAATAALAAYPAISGTLLAVIGSISVVAVVVRLGRVPALRPRIAVLALVTTGAGVTSVLGATGGPWCVPDSVFQAHAAWHALSAAGVSLAALSLAQANLLDRSGPVPAEVTR